MPKIEYVSKRFNEASRRKIAVAEEICDEYAALGYTLTLRQLYYQFVARDLIPNSQKEYDNLGSLINNARLAGYIDWNHLGDRTRNVRSLSHWETPADILDAAAASYRFDLWARQPYYLEVWIEKDALVGVIEGVCQRNDVPFFSCRGYTSQSEMWGAAQRIRQAQGGTGIRSRREGQRSVTIIHLGDHDPSGIDMTRDIDDRLEMFVTKDDGGWDSGYEPPLIRRIALTSQQVEYYSPPPNPAKVTDSRARDYIRRHGTESWELDALDPTTLDTLLQTTIDEYKDVEIWTADCTKMTHQRAEIEAIAAKFREEAA